MMNNDNRLLIFVKFTLDLNNITQAILSASTDQLDIRNLPN